MAFIPFAATVGGWIGATGAGAAAAGGTAIVATAATAASIGLTISSSMAQAKASQELLSSQIPSPEVTEETAAAIAQKAMIARRRTILAAGGQTDITQGTATLGSTGKLKTLLG